MCLLPGLLPDVPAYTVKVNAKFPGATPALRGIVCLHSLADGELLALLDSASVTAWRTGLAAALATHVLAPEQARTVAVIGAGAQSRATLRALRTLRPVDEVAPTTSTRTGPRRSAAPCPPRGRPSTPRTSSSPPPGRANPCWTPTY